MYPYHQRQESSPETQSTYKLYKVLVEIREGSAARGLKRQRGDQNRRFCNFGCHIFGVFGVEANITAK